MRKLQNISVDGLKAAFNESTDSKAIRRLAMAIAYRDGVSVDTLSARYDIPRSTIYVWLDRFENEPIETAVRDETRPGRPAELEPREFVELSSDIADGPRAHGIDADSWTANLLKSHISEAYDVVYSEGHARRLLRQLRPESPE